MSNTDIISVDVCKYFENGPLIEVVATSNGKSEVFFVKTFHGEYSSDCSITTHNRNGHVNQDDYPNFDLDKIADAAEKLSQSFYAKTEYYYNGYRMWIHQSKPCNFWIFYSSPFFGLVIDDKPADSFCTLEEALEYAKEIADEN